MKLSFKCRGKVIIFGEYAVLNGGFGLVGTTAPEFTLTATKTNSTGFKHPFAPGSPAGLLITHTLHQHVENMGGYSLEWHDPFDTPIGVGSSSAQFVLAHQALSVILGHKKTQQPTDSETLLHDYWDVVSESQGLRPSGVDVVSQNEGGVTLFRNEPFLAESLECDPFMGRAEFWLAYTGSKLRTHEHLLQLQQRGFPHGEFVTALSELNAITLSGVEAWRNGDATRVGALLNEYQDVMCQAQFSDAPVIELINNARLVDGVLGVKGSGAQGGDCALFLIRPEAKAGLETFCKTQNWALFPAHFTR